MSSPAGVRIVVEEPSRPLSPAQWLAADIQPPRYALGAVIGFDTRMMLAANTGAGKTMFAIALAVAVYLGRDFLGWKASGAPMRVLFIDGEMPATLMRDRIGEAFRWFGEDAANHSDGIYFLSRDFFPDMPPLDTEKGQAWFGNIVKDISPDFIVFDNLMALTCSSLKEDAGWQVMKPWLLGLRCGWLLVHHTGHDGTKAYGDKAREWNLDAVAMMQPVDAPGADLAFKLHFTKARRRTPANRTDFEDRHIELRQGQWSTLVGGTAIARRRKLTLGQEKVLGSLQRAIEREGEPVPGGPDEPSDGRRGVREDAWRECYHAVRPVEEGDKSGHDARSKAFRQGRDALKDNGFAAQSVSGLWYVAPL